MRTPRDALPAGSGGEGSAHPCRLPVALLLCLLLVLALAGCRESSKSARPNVLIVVIDALRWDYLGVNGFPGPISPHIDQLATEGVTFTHARSQCTWTKPSIASLFTSKLPAEHGIFLVGRGEGEHLMTQVLGDRFRTLAEAFRKAGYATGASINQVHLARNAGFAQGFDWYRRRRGTSAPTLIRQLLKWLDQSSGKPFLAYLHVMDVHWPYRSQVEASRLPGAPVPASLPECARHAEQSSECLAKTREWLSRPEGREGIEELKRRYARGVEYTDAALGRLFEELHERGLYKNTIIVVTADHGEGFGEHGHLQHGFAPFEEVMRVPLVVRLPRRLRTRVGHVDAPVALIDLYPTLTSLAGLNSENGPSGRDLSPLLKGSPMRSRIIVSESVAGDAATDGRWKLMRFPDGRFELFDLRQDPGEQHPVEGVCEGACAALRDRLIQVEAEAQSRMHQASEEVEVDPQDVKDLRALGYL